MHQTCSLQQPVLRSLFCGTQLASARVQPDGQRQVAAHRGPICSSKPESVSSPAVFVEGSSRSKNGLQRAERLVPRAAARGKPKVLTLTATRERAQEVERLDAAANVVIEIERLQLERQWELSTSADTPVHEAEAVRSFLVDEQDERGSEQREGRVDEQDEEPAGPSTRISEGKGVRVRRADSQASSEARRRRLDLRRQRVQAAGGAAPVASFAHKSKRARKAPEQAWSRSGGVPDEVTLFLRQLGRQELLTKEQEVGLAELVVDGRQLEIAKESLEQERGREATYAELADHVGIDDIGVLRQRLRDAAEAKEKLITCNLRLVVSVAKKYTRLGMDMADLIQEGAFGLRRGIEKFDHTRGYKLSTYVHWWIRQAITRAIAENSRIIRLPVHVHETASRIRRLYPSYDEVEGKLSPEEIAEKLNISATRVKNCMKAMRQRIVPYDLKLAYHSGKGGSGDNTLDQILEDPKRCTDPMVLLQKDMLEDDVVNLLQVLEPREREVVKLHFGVAGVNTPLTYETIGNRLGVSRERVRQVEMAALRKLRDPLDDMQLSDYLTMDRNHSY